MPNRRHPAQGAGLFAAQPHPRTILRPAVLLTAQPVELSLSAFEVPVPGVTISQRTRMQMPRKRPPLGQHSGGGAWVTSSWNTQTVNSGIVNAQTAGRFFLPQISCPRSGAQTKGTTTLARDRNKRGGGAHFGQVHRPEKRGIRASGSRCPRFRVRSDGDGSRDQPAGNLASGGMTLAA